MINIRNDSCRQKKSPPMVSCRLGCARRHHIALGYHLAPEGRLAWARAQLLMLSLLCGSINWRVNVLEGKKLNFSRLVQAAVPACQKHHSVAPRLCTAYPEPLIWSSHLVGRGRLRYAHRNCQLMLLEVMDRDWCHMHDGAVPCAV